MSGVWRALAPGKVNLALILGPLRPDGRHEMATVIESVSLADELVLSPADGPADEVVCPGVEGENLAARALAAYRERSGWDGPPVRLEIGKHVPVAAGMGGGSGDAAAALRLVACAAGHPGDPRIGELAPELGSDVPSQVHPGLVFGSGAGDRVRAAEPLPEHAHVVLVLDRPLSTAAVFAEADRLGIPRTAGELEERAESLVAALDAGDLPLELMENDLEVAARSLCPEIEPAVAALQDAGCEHAMVSGSGATCFGIVRGADALARAREIAGALRPRVAHAVEPVGAAFGEPRA